MGSLCSCCTQNTVVEGAVTSSNKQQKNNLSKDTQNEIDNQQQQNNEGNKQMSQKGTNNVFPQNQQNPQEQPQNNIQNNIGEVKTTTPSQAGACNQPSPQSSNQENAQSGQYIQQIQKDQPKIREEEIKVLLLGQGGVGKKRLLQSLEQDNKKGRKSEKENENEFKKIEYTYKNYKFCVVGTPDFEMEDDIDVREQRITQFQSYFDNCNNKIQAFLILVNFERTDLMKKKVMSVFKFMRKFQNKMLLAITQFDLSENQKEDQKHLEDKLKHFINYERIMFLRKDDSAQVIKQNIYEKTLILLDKEETFDEALDFKDTLFEKVDEQEQKKMMQELNKAMGENRSK